MRRRRARDENLECNVRMGRVVDAKGSHAWTSPSFPPCTRYRDVKARHATWGDSVWMIRTGETVFINPVVRLGGTRIFQIYTDPESVPTARKRARCPGTPASEPEACICGNGEEAGDDILEALDIPSRGSSATVSCANVDMSIATEVSRENLDPLKTKSVALHSVLAIVDMLWLAWLEARDRGWLVGWDDCGVLGPPNREATGLKFDTLEECSELSAAPDIFWRTWRRIEAGWSWVNPQLMMKICSPAPFRSSPAKSTLSCLCMSQPSHTLRKCLGLKAKYFSISFVSAAIWLSLRPIESVEDRGL